MIIHLRRTHAYKLYIVHKTLYWNVISLNQFQKVMQNSEKVQGKRLKQKEYIH